MAAASTALLEVMDGDDAIGVDSKLPEFLPLWAKAGGVDLVSEDGRTAQLDAPEVAEALEWAVGLYNDQGGFSAVKSIRDSADFFGAENQFATDSLGAMPKKSADRKSTRLNSSHVAISYAVFCLKKKRRTVETHGQ